MMKLRIAEEKDAAGIARVHIDTWRECYKGIVPASYLDQLSYEDRTTGWAKGLAAGSEPGYVAELDKEIVGWVTFGKNRDDRPADIAEIYGIYVLPEHWGTEVGLALFNAAIEALQQQATSKITLWVLEGNIRAKAFYKKNRFQPDGTAKTVNIGGADLVEVRYERLCVCESHNL